METIDSWIILTLLFLFGTILGSFLNVCIYRLPRSESVAWPPSHCPSCNQRVAWHDNIPILSYLILLAKCRNCRAPISWRYPLVELLGGLMLVCTYMLGFDLPYFTMISVIFLSYIVVTFIDLEHQIIPDEISVGGVVVGLVFSTFFPAWHGASNYLSGFLMSLLGVLAGGGILYLIAIVSEWILKKEGMGGGDIKLLAAIGAFFGWKASLFSLFVGSTLGCIAFTAMKPFTKEDRLAFGPYLAMGSMVWVIWGEKILGWYLASMLKY